MYKYSCADEKTVTNLETGATGIHPGGWMWEEYQNWIASGGITEPFDARSPSEILGADKARVQAANKTVCENHILKRFSLPIQSSMSMGVYPADMKDAMVSFIAACIAEENRVFDLVVAAATQEELLSIIPVWPEV